MAAVAAAAPPDDSALWSEARQVAKDSGSAQGTVDAGASALFTLLASLNVVTLLQFKQLIRNKDSMAAKIRSDYMAAYRAAPGKPRTEKAAQNKWELFQTAVFKHSAASTHSAAPAKRVSRKRPRSRGGAANGEQASDDDQPNSNGAADRQQGGAGKGGDKADGGKEEGGGRDPFDDTFVHCAGAAGLT
jgi:hypothetical protein